MKRWKVLIPVSTLLTGLFLVLPCSLAQDPAPADEAMVDSAADDSKSEFGLYLGFGSGVANADKVDTSLETLTTHRATSFLSLDDQDFARAEIGWQFPNDKGDLRLTFNGYKETENELHSIGTHSSLPNGATATGLLDWWILDVVDGRLTAQRRPPQWNRLLDDADNDGAADPNEVRYDVVDRTVNDTMPRNYNNQVQSMDLMYGREFGTRRFNSHWWAGLRYLQYQGNLPSPFWMGTLTSGEGFSDGAYLDPVIFFQEASGYGPVGAWDVEVNFFNKGLVLYLEGQSAFTFNTLEVDSGDFVTLTQSTSSNVNVLAGARLTDKREKSSWSNRIEAGIRANFRNGLTLNAGYHQNGFLDVILRPFDLTIPTSPAQAQAGTSALINTQDYRIDGWHAGLSFQF